MHISFIKIISFISRTKKPSQFADHLIHRISWDEIDENDIRKIIEIARAEDIHGAGLKSKPPQTRDLTTDTLAPSTIGSVMLVARQEMVLCGLHLIKIILNLF